MVKSLRTLGAFLYKWWMQFARALAFLNTRIILTMIYFFVIGPIFLVMRLVGKDFLQRRIEPNISFWKPREKKEDSLETARKQF